LIYASAIALIPLIVVVIYEPDISSNQAGRPKSDLSYPRTRVAVVYALAFLGMVMFYMIPVQIPFLLEGFPDISKTQIGMAISIATLTAALASSSYRRLRKKLTFMQIYAFTFILMALAFLFISQASSYAEVLGGLAIAGLGAGLLMPNSNLWIISLAPPPLRGRLVGGITMSVFLGQFFSPILVEPVSSLASLPLAFAAAAITMALLGTLLGFYGFRLSRHREIQP
ncbi:MAG: MFS transporter, partial [Bacteroidota bacterium]